MDDDRQIEAELQRNFHLLACSLPKTTGPIFTKVLHDILALVAPLNHAIQGVSAFRSRTPEQRVKVVDFDICQNAQKLFGYHSNVPWSTTKLMSVL